MICPSTTDYRTGLDDIGSKQQYMQGANISEPMEYKNNGDKFMIINWWRVTDIRVPSRKAFDRDVSLKMQQALYLLIQIP